MHLCINCNPYTYIIHRMASHYKCLPELLDNERIKILEDIDIFNTICHAQYNSSTSHTVKPETSALLNFGKI